MKEFLKHFPGHIICTIDDKVAKGAEPKREKPLSGLVSEHKKKEWKEEDLKEINSRGGGVFFAYNNFGNIAGTSRKKENVQGINAWAMEIDSIPKSEQWKKILKSPLNPSIIIETRNSYHCYWLSKDAKVENAERILSGMIQYFDSDPALKDTARLLRIPGFNHNKQEPFMVRVEMADYDLKYTDEEMLGAFPYLEPKPIIATRKWKAPDTDDFWKAANSLPCMQVLDRLSGDSIVNGEVFSFRKRNTNSFYIDVNGEPANAWIDEQGLIGSGSGGAPTIVSWLRYYGNDFKTIAEWIKGNCKDMLPSAVLESVPTKLLKQVKESPPTKEKTYYTWNTEGMNNTLWPIKQNTYMILMGLTTSGKTSFCFDLGLKNAKAGKKVVYILLEMTLEQLIERRWKARSGVSPQQERKGEYTEAQLKVKEQVEKEINEALNFTVISNTTGYALSIENILQTIKESGADMAIIDNLDKIKKENTAMPQEYISEMALNFTNTENIPIIMVHHANIKKATKFDSGGGGLMAMARGTGKIPDDSDMFVVLSRSMEEDLSKEEKSKALVRITKERVRDMRKTYEIYFHHDTYYDEYPKQITYWQDNI